MITLYASSDDPEAHGHYIARITGRNEQWMFARIWIGKREGAIARARVDEPGVYQVCDVLADGTKRSTYFVVVPRPAHIAPTRDQADEHLMALFAPIGAVMSIARRLDAGERIEHFLEVVPGEDGEGYDFRERSHTEMRRAIRFANLDALTDAVWDVVGRLSHADQKLVIAELKARSARAKPLLKGMVEQQKETSPV